MKKDIFDYLVIGFKAFFVLLIVFTLGSLICSLLIVNLQSEFLSFTVGGFLGTGSCVIIKEFILE